jgi:hypothetical protein
MSNGQSSNRYKVLYESESDSDDDGSIVSTTFETMMSEFEMLRQKDPGDSYVWNSLNDSNEHSDTEWYHALLENDHVKYFYH